MLRKALLVVLVYAALAAAITWPTVLDPARHIPGGERTDLWDGLWSFWFAAERLDSGVLPMRVDGLLNHPLGGTLWVIDPLNALIMWPLQHLVGLATAYSLLVLIHLAATGSATWLLARSVTGSERAAWIAGAAFEASPLMISHVHNGATEAIGGAFVPLAAWATWRTYQSPGPLNGALCAGTLALAAVGHWYSGVDAFVFWGLIVLASLANWGQGGGTVVARLLWLLVAGVVAALVIMPVANISLVASSSADSVVEIKTGDDLAAIRRTLGPADPVGFFHPGDYRTPDFRVLSQFAEDHIHCVYIGFVLLAGAAIAAFRRSRGLAVLWVAAIVSLLLAMGPVVVHEGNPVLLRPDLPVLLPYAVLERFPGFSSLSLLYRLSELGMVALAILAGVGWASLGRIAAAVSTLVMLLEVAVLSPVAGLPGHTDGRIPAAMFSLASAPEGAVINFPIAGGRAYLYHQSAHGKPLAATLNFTANSTALTLWELCLALAEEMDPSVRAQLISGEAYRLGVRYLVAHPDPNVNPDSLSNAMQVIRSTYRPAIEGDGIEIYRFY